MLPGTVEAYTCPNSLPPKAFQFGQDEPPPPQTLVLSWRGCSLPAETEHPSGAQPATYKEAKKSSKD